MGWFDEEEARQRRKRHGRRGLDRGDQEQATIISSYETARQERNTVVIL
jgi:hypothetical protein